MDWFKKNPFFGALIAVTVLGVAATGYYLFGALARFDTENTAFEQNKSTLQNLQGAKPFPNSENVAKAKQELEDARKVLHDIAQAVKVNETPSTPNAFQDELRDKVNEITSRAAAAGIKLGDNFYLGFESYQAQPPTDAAAPKLALQLQSIYKVASILVDANVREIASIAREPLPMESAAAQPPAADKPGKPKPPKAEGALPDLNLAPFTISFVADQSAFRLAFNRILDVEPLVFIRLVSVANSAPDGPLKTTTSAPAPAPAPGPGPDAAETANKPVVGRELLTINLQLASISAGSAPEAKK